MPRRNVIKEFCPDSWYHVYNRGVRGLKIFEDKRDKYTFLYLLKKYLDPDYREKKFDPVTGEPKYVRSNYVYEDAELLAFCLMPNHFHLLVKDISGKGTTMLMRRVVSNYATYYNKESDTSGALFESTYKGVPITSEEQLLHVSRYIHLNPAELVDKLENYPFSSYPVYLGRKNVAWVKPKEILDCFGPTGIELEMASETGFNPVQTYRKFVESYQLTDEEKELVQSFSLQ
ncbi:transposase [Patescibacteria group bacterium]|nr:transposase [Patescibacteria group bacterium]